MSGELEAPLTEEQLAPLLGVSRHTLRAWRRQGRGPAYARYGRAVRYQRGDVATWAQAMRVEMPDFPKEQGDLTPQ